MRDDSSLENKFMTEDEVIDKRLKKYKQYTWD